MNKKIVSATLGIMCLLLTVAIIVQYKTIEDASQIIGTDDVNSELKTEVLSWKEKYDEAYKELQDAEKKLETAREEASKNSGASSESERNLKIANAIIGTTDVTGSGIVVTLADNQNVTSDSIGVLENISNYLIHDSDLLTLVNELKNAGAEAISINDERITNSTSITCDGNVVLINGNKVSSPFIVKAIGSQEALLGAIERPGGFLEILERYGLVSSVQKQNKITFRNLITWDKGNGQGQLSSEYRMYPIADEKCLFVQVGIQCLTLNADQYWEEYEPIRKYLYDERIKCGWDIPTMKTIAGHSDKRRDHWTSKSQWNLPTQDVYIKFQNWAKEHNIEAFTKQYEELRVEYEELRAYFDNTHDNMNNVWHFNKTSGEERENAGGHATPKPIALCTRAIKSSSRENENVLDVFGGSGSTLIACEQNNRNCYVMELEPKWVDVIIQRWETFTGKKAVKLN